MLQTIDRYFGRLFAENYSVSKFRSHLHFLWSLSKQPLLIYTMGKVGSSTIAKSLRATDSVHSVYSLYHIHWLDRKRLDYEEQLFRKAQRRSRNSSVARHRFFPTYVWMGRDLADLIRKREGQKWKIITLVRDPIARNISSFFQNLETLLSYDYRSMLKVQSPERIADDLKNLFEKHYLVDDNLSKIDANPLTWFDQELRQAFDLDVYRQPFPKGKGFEIYDSRRASVLLIRLEDLSACSKEAFQKFLGLDRLELVRANTGRGKAYSTIYEAFLQELSPPKDYVERLYSSKYSKHFYTDEENLAFLRKWTR